MDAVVIKSAMAVILMIATQATPGLFITVHSETGQPLEGVEVYIEATGGFSSQALTDNEGQARITGVTAGTYRIAVRRDPFEESTQSFEIEDARQQIDIDVMLSVKVQRNDRIDVVADGATLGATEAASPGAVLDSTQIASLPIHAATVADTLPLVPGVNRGSNGEIQISGQGEQQSALLVNSSDVTDPTTGRFGSTVPVSSVESIDVLKAPFLPEYGRFTSGVVAVSTKRGGDKWHFSLKEPIPDFRVRSGRFIGLRDATPRFGVGGPVLANKLYFSESTDYTLEKRQVRTLSFPHNVSKVESVNSFTQFDYILSAKHFITATVHVTPQHTNYVDPQFFNPQEVSPSSRGIDKASTLTEHSNIAGGLLDSTVSRQDYHALVGAQGDADMVLTPTGNLGNYFARRTRDSARTEWTETFSRSIGGPNSHSLRFGSSIARMANSGSFSFNPIEILDQQQNRLKRIEFTSGTPFAYSDLESAFFAQDHWMVLPGLSLDGGARYEYQQRTKTYRLAPRISASWVPLPEGRLVLRSGIGVFYDRVPLTVYSFPYQPEQMLSTYDASGQLIGAPQRFVNLTQAQAGERFPLLSSAQVPGNFAPYSKTWTVEAEHTVARTVRLRLGYQHSDSGGGIIIDPQSNAGSNALVLNGNGHTTYRQLEMTAKVSWKNGQQMLFSFVHARTRGDLNQFSLYLGDYPAAYLSPNASSNLRGDIPNRFVSWGFVNLPLKLRFAPIFEYRTGQPYAVIDASRNYFGTPYGDSTRLLNFFGLDASVSRQIRMLHKYSARVALTGLNLTNHFNALDVHNNIADPQFGVFFGHYKRRYRVDIEFLF